MPSKTTKPDLLPIPEATRQRKSSYVDAAILYIHGRPETGERITTIAELARETGAAEEALRKASVDDDWEGFRQELLAKAYRENMGGQGLAIMGRVRGEKEREAIAKEAKRQADQIETLESEAKRLLDSLPGLKPGSLDHSRALASLKMIREELEHATGKKAHDTEQAARFTAALAAATEQAKRNAGRINQPAPSGGDDALTIEGDALPAW